MGLDAGLGSGGAGGGLGSGSSGTDPNGTGQAKGGTSGGPNNGSNGAGPPDNSGSNAGSTSAGGRAGSTSGGAGANGNGNGDGGRAADASGEAGGNAMGDAGADAAAVPPLTSDGEVLGVLAEVNAGEVQHAVLARMRVKTPAVLDFADMMFADHTAAGARIASLAASAKIAPADSPLRVQLGTQAKEIGMQLAAITDVPAFEAAYIGAQATMHAMVLQIIDTQLLPVARDGAVKGEVSSERAAVAMHLARARALQAVDGGATGDGGRAPR
jgi:putative membrane protein